MTEEWAKQMPYYVCSGILLSHRRSEIRPFAITQMDPEITLLSEVTEGQIPRDIADVRNL